MRIVESLVTCYLHTDEIRFLIGFGLASQLHRRYGNRQGHTVIVGSRQRIQPVRNNTDSRQQHNNI